MSDKFFVLNRVLDLADEVIAEGESPFAAGLLVDDKLFLASNKCRTESNPNLHAEIVCINEFCKQEDYHSLEKAIMFTSCEPCLMCFHSIYNAGIRHIVYAATIDDAIKFGSGDEPFRICDYAEKMKFNIEIEGPLLRKKAIQIFEKCIAYRGEL